jgi:hypothetical protein
LEEGEEQAKRHGIFMGILKSDKFNNYLRFLDQERQAGTNMFQF